MKVNTLNRRHILYFLGTSLISALSHKATAETHWDYEGSDPEHWSRLTDEYRACGIGTKQSPVNLDHNVQSKLPQLKLEYNDHFISVVNNGHTIMVTAGRGNELLVEDKQFSLAQFHFHHPSEHRLKGQQFPAECHLVHNSDQHGTAVLAIMMQVGKANPTFERVLQLAPGIAGKEKPVPDGRLEIADLLPDVHHYISYKGSLTTPPCTEGVNWFVLVKPVQISLEQLRQFAALYPDNARPVQPLNNRTVFED